MAAARAAEQNRGAFLLGQQRRFYEVMDSGSGSALATWRSTRLERESTYMAENREAAGAGERSPDDVGSGGYEQVALALMRAIALDEHTTLILNVRNRRALDVLDSDAVVEVPCYVDANGARPVAIDPLPDYAKGLVCSIKTVERQVIEAATTGSRRAALRALAMHPLVDSATVADRLLDAYQQHFPGLHYLKASSHA